MKPFYFLLIVLSLLSGHVCLEARESSKPVGAGLWNNAVPNKSGGLSSSAVAMKNLQAGAAKDLFFVENKGQVRDQDGNARPDIQYQLKATGGLNIFIGNGAIHYQFSKADKGRTGSGEQRAASFAKATADERERGAESEGREEKSYTMYRMDVELVGADKHAAVIAAQQQSYYENYYTPGTGDNGARALAWKKITYREVYPHIDWVLYARGGKLKHEFIIRKGGRVSDIQLKYGGATGLRITEDGSLEAKTPEGVITEEAPVTSQADGKAVSSMFKLTGDVLSYKTAAYEGDLLVDPMLLWATYYGAGGDERGLSVAADGTGNVYMCGKTNSIIGIATSGAYQTTYGGWLDDAFLIKFDRSGIRQWATYYGGPGDEGRSTAITTDGAGNVYLAGWTTSTSGIASSGAHQDTYGGGGNDAFLVKFDGTGIRQWATYYGGTGADYGYAVGTDATGNVYLTGGTTSASGIASPGAYQTILSGGGGDAYLVKFDGLGARQWATYYGGNAGYEFGGSVCADGAGNVYLTGGTTSTSGIATSGAYQNAYGGGTLDAYLAKFDITGMLQWATYYGGPGTDGGNSVATDGLGNAYFVGTTNSATGIASPGAYQSGLVGSVNACLAKFDGMGARQWATYYGPTSGGYDPAVATDGISNVYVTGTTNSSSGIASADAYQATYGGGTNDAYLVKFDALGTREWATYYGGASDDYGISVTTNGSGTVYLAGGTTSTSAIASAGAHQTTQGGGEDAFLAVFNDLDTIAGSLTFCQGATVTLSDRMPGGIWSSGSTAIAAIGSSTGIVTGLAAGTAVISYAVGISSVTKTVTVQLSPVPITIGTGTFAICQGASVSLSDATSGGTWSSSPAGVATITSGGYATGVATGSTSAATTTITYQLTATGCNVTQVVTVNPQPSVSGPASVCETASITLAEFSGAPGAWSSGLPGIASVGSATGIVSGAAAGTAMISYIATGGCYSTAMVTVMPMPAAITGPANVCGGRTISLSTGPGGGGWYISPATAGSISGTGVVTGAATAVAVPAVVSYSLAMCGVSYPITINPQPVITGPTVVCHYANVNLYEATGTVGAWSAPAGAVSATGVVTGTATGMIPITFTAATGGCADIRSMTVNPVPVPITGATSVCQMRTTTLADADPGGAWSSGASSIASITASGVVSGVLPGTAAISYSFPATGCYASATVTVLAAPVISLTAGGPTSFCPGGSVTLSATPGFTYQWLDGGVPISTATGMSYVASTSGSFAVTATNAAGCSATSLPIHVSAGADPVIIPSGLVYFCQGGSTTLTASTGSAVGTMTYQWFRNGIAISGATSVTYPADTVGTYTCNVALTTGSVTCSGVTPPVTVTVVPRPMPVIHTSGTAFVTDNHSWITYQWYLNTVAIPGANSWSIVPVFYGSYRLEVTDTNGCAGYSTSIYYGPGGVQTEAGNIQQQQIAIYPNPATSIVNIDAPMKVRAIITGMEGKVLIDQPAAVQVDVSGLAPGVYMIALYDDSGARVKVEKLIR